MTDDDPIDALVLEYLRATEAGEQPDLDALAARLPDPSQRQELRSMVDTAAWLRASFPTPFRPQAMVADRYRLLESLGSGGFGKVWRAHDEKLGRDVALKLLHPLLPADETAATLTRERQALAAVRHDGIVRLLDSGQHEYTPFLAMELVAGCPVDRVVAALAAGGDAAYPPNRVAVQKAIGLLPVAGTVSLLTDSWFETTAQITISVLWALAAAHAHGIVHRDLKPGNVLLRGDGRPVVLDFGLAGLADRAGGLTERLFGTAAYIAPEQLESQRMGKAVHTDVYQCGLLLYELLTLRRAFGDEARSRLLTAVRQGEFARPRAVRPSIPRELEDICLRALERDAQRRYADADAFRADLERWLAGELPRASRLGLLGRALRGARTQVRRHPVALGAAAALLLGVTATIFAMTRMPPFDVQIVSARAIALDVHDSGSFALWATAADHQTSSPLAIVPADGKARRYASSLDPGRHLLAVDRDLPAAAAGVVRVLYVASTVAVDDLESFCRDVRRLELDHGAPLTQQELDHVLAEHRQPGRGGSTSSLGEVTLTQLFAD